MTAEELYEKLLCVEFGYKQREKGANLQAALEAAQAVLTGKKKPNRTEGA